MLAAEPKTGHAGISLVGESPSDDFDPDGEPTEPSDWEPYDVPSTDDDSNWDVFLPDDDQQDPLPDPGDFWVDTSHEDRAESPDGTYTQLRKQ